MWRASEPPEDTLTGLVEVDESDIGGKEPGLRGGRSVPIARFELIGVNDSLRLQSVQLAPEAGAILAGVAALVTLGLRRRASTS